MMVVEDLGITVLYVHTQPPDPLEPKEPPPTNQRTVCELITNPTTPLPLRAFKSAHLNLIEEFGGSEDQLPWTPCLLQGTFLHSLVSVGFALLCAGEWTQVWVGNTSSTKLPPSTGNVSRRGGGGWKHFKHLISNLASRCQHLSQKWVIACQLYI